MEPERSKYWRDAFFFFTQAYYYELLASLLSRRWEKWGSWISFVIAITASGSAISGWAVWHQNRLGTIAWAVFVGMASLLSIAQDKLNVQAHINKQRLLRKRFAQIRGALQILLSDIESGQDLARIEAVFKTQREKYFDLTASVDSDMFETLFTRRRAKADQVIVLQELGYDIIQEGKVANENPTTSTHR